MHEYLTAVAHFIVMRFRVEKDSLGRLKIPEDAYWGIHTQRALETFKVSRRSLPWELTSALVTIKKAAAMANMRAGRLDRKKAVAISKACDEILAGKFYDQFPLDAFQAGAGTNQNMNANEVIANRSIELLGGRKADYSIIHPNDHVNMSQSTNDVFHSAMNMAAFIQTRRILLPSVKSLEKALLSKSKEFADIVKSGRTHLKDAVPVTLGQEFSGYAEMAAKSARRISEASHYLLELNIGGTAAGTGLNAGKEYRAFVLEEINRLTGMKFRHADNMFEATQSADACVAASSALRGLATSMIKICNDLRLLDSGPVSGLHEITLPPVMAGSSIMPGKVNPSIPEMANMACFQAIGNDACIVHAGSAGQLELNAMMPVMALNLLGSIEMLSNASRILAERCIPGITANRDKCLQHLERNPVIATALAPHIGYEKAAEIVKEAYESGRPIRDIILGKRLLPKKQLDRILDFKKMAGV